MPPKLIKASTKMKVKVSGSDSVSFEVRQALFSTPTTLPSTLSTRFLAWPCKITQGFRFGLTSICRRRCDSEMQGLLEALNHHATVVGISINASKTKVMSAIIPIEQRQAVLLDAHLKQPRN